MPSTVLPVLGEAPSVTCTTNKTVTLEWTKWNEDVDIGDPPVVGYVVFARQSSGDWTEKVRLNQSITYVAVGGLDPGTDYEFSIAAVREGTGGTGPRSPPVSE